MPTNRTLKIESYGYLNQFLKNQFGPLLITFPEKHRLYLALDHFITESTINYRPSKRENLLEISIPFPESRKHDLHYFLYPFRNQVFLNILDRYFQQVIEMEIKTQHKEGVKKKDCIKFCFEKFDLSDDCKVQIAKVYQRYIVKCNYYKKKSQKKRSNHSGS